MRAIVSTFFECAEMKSKKHAALHEILGKTLVEYVTQAARDAGFEVVEVNNESDAKEIIELDAGSPNDYLILAGNAPLITSEALAGLAEFHKKSQNHISWISCDSPDGEGKPPGKGKFAVIAVAAGFLNEKMLRLSDLEPDTGLKLGTMTVSCVSELICVYDRMRFAEAYDIMRERINTTHMRNGVTLIEPKSTFIDADVSIGCDTVIYPGCFLEKGAKIGEDCIIGPEARICGAEIADGVEVSRSVILDSKVGKGTAVGPYAYIRPGSVIGEHCKIGNFVDIKNSVIGNGTKAGHLVYVGDSEVGCGVNFGCGTVTVNYDGVHKHKTIVDDNAFIGCNTNLVAPVKIGKNAYTAAGSTIVQDVEPDSLAIARSRQVGKPDWVVKRAGK